MTSEKTKKLFKKAWVDPQFESETLSKRPLRGVQAEIIKKVERFIASHSGGVMTIMSSRQTGKNETAAVLQRRHLWAKQKRTNKASWIRTAPTHKPQIVNSVKRLEELLRLNSKNIALHPSFLGKKIQKSEGYIWKFGNATVEFMSSGPQSNVVGATASECLDMDEAHKIEKEKFDEDFAPFTASTNAATLLWGVAADGLDTLEWYRQNNKDSGKPHLILRYPCEIWADVVPTYDGHLQSRIDALGWDHPVIKTQYRLIPVSQEGTFINGAQARSLLSGEHQREQVPRDGVQYGMLVDVAAGNEDFNPDQVFVGEGDTATDSTIVWIYRLTGETCSNGIFPVIHIVNCYWWTGVTLPNQQRELKDLVQYWRVENVTIDSIGVGRQLAESLVETFGEYIVKAYTASNTTISEDCFDFLARLNFDSVKMFQNDHSPEWTEFEKQVGWTKYSSNKGQVNLIKPGSDKHIDMVKALTYINQNNPEVTVQKIISIQGDE